MNPMMRLIALMVLLASPVMAATMTVDADVLEVNRAAKQAVFTGNVVVIRPDMTLRCARLEGDFGKALNRMVATGGVVIVHKSPDGDVVAKGPRAEYSPTQGGIVMTGGVTLTQGGHTLVGDRLDYDMKAGKARLSSANRVRATMAEEK